MHPNWRLGPLPRHVPWKGIKPATFHFAGWRPTNGATVARAPGAFLILQPHHLSRHLLITTLIMLLNFSLHPHLTLWELLWLQWYLSIPCFEGKARIKTKTSNSLQFPQDTVGSLSHSFAVRGLGRATFYSLPLFPHCQFTSQTETFGFLPLRSILKRSLKSHQDFTANSQAFVEYFLSSPEHFTSLKTLLTLDFWDTPLSLDCSATLLAHVLFP